MKSSRSNLLAVAVSIQFDAYFLILPQRFSHL